MFPVRPYLSPGSPSHLSKGYAVATTPNSLLADRGVGKTGTRTPLSNRIVHPGSRPVRASLGGQVRPRSEEGILPRSFQTGRILLCFLLLGCSDDSTEPADTTPPVVDRLAAIPSDVSKITPDQDPSPPILHSDQFQEPVPLPVINTAGGEDAPFIPAGRDELYFFFAADVRQPASVQVQDPVNGIWMSRRSGSTWREPELVWLQEYDELALNGCPFVAGDEMIFCTARAGYTGVQWFQAERLSGTWADWGPVTFPAAFDVGELHIDQDELYYGSPRAGGAGGQDIWVLSRDGDAWGDPVNVAAVNSSADETRPFVTSDGSELWITRWHEGSPAVFRSRRSGGVWQPPELIVSRFAGEPTLDAQGNLYFVHHFYADGVMLEADIYVALKK